MTKQEIVQRFYRVTGSVPTVPGVPETTGGNSPVTVETLVTGRNTGAGDDGINRPIPVLPRAAKWWQRNDGGWVCGRCHPNPNREILFKLEVEGGGSPPSLL